MKALRFAAVLASFICVPNLAFAHGASRLKLTELVEINAPAAKVWKVIGNFHDMSWLPGVVSTTGPGDNTPEVAKRVITLKGGATVEESLYKYDAGDMSYSYEMDQVDLKVLPVTNYSSTLTVTADGGNPKSIGAALSSAAIRTSIRRRI